MNNLVLASHPRLLFGPDDVPVLREKITREPWASMFKHLLATLEFGHWGDKPADGNEDDYSELTIAHRNAFTYVLTGDDAYAKRAREMIERRLADPGHMDKRGKGLTLYIHGIYFALVYDYCHGAPSWDKAFSDRISKKLKEHGDLIGFHGGSHQNRSLASNWQALRWSSAALCWMASDEAVEQKNLDVAWRNVNGYLRANLGQAGSGWNCEGLGYTFFPMGNGVVPFGIAMHRRDPSRDLRQATPAAPFTLWTVFAGTVRNRTGMWRADFADDNPGTRFEGTAGFAFWMCPPELHGELAWAYDRLVGAAGDQTWDSSRFGIVSSILFHPGDAVAKRDPMNSNAWKQLFDDRHGNGMFLFRNAYLGPDDLAVQVFAKLLGNRGHQGPDSLSYRIYGFDGMWGVGGGRYGKQDEGIEIYHRSQNTLYPIDPEGQLKTNGERGSVVDHGLNDDGSGFVTLGAARNNVGTQNHTRSLAVSFDPALQAHAAVVVLDTSADGLVWQHCTLDTHDIKVDENGFTITGPTGNTLRGTVLHPANATIRTGRRERGSNAGDVTHNHWIAIDTGPNALVVLTLQRAGEAPPTVRLEGSLNPAKPDARIVIGRQTMRLQGTKIQPIEHP